MILDTILAELKNERDRLHRAISVLEGTAPRRGRPKKNAQAPTVRRRRRMSAEARRRISEAKRKWWAERKKKRSGPGSGREVDYIRFGDERRSWIPGAAENEDNCWWQGRSEAKCAVELGSRFAP